MLHPESLYIVLHSQYRAGSYHWGLYYHRAGDTRRPYGRKFHIENEGTGRWMADYQDIYGVLCRWKPRRWRSERHRGRDGLDSNSTLWVHRLVGNLYTVYLVYCACTLRSYVIYSNMLCSNFLIGLIRIGIIPTSRFEYMKSLIESTPLNTPGITCRV